MFIYSCNCFSGLWFGGSDHNSAANTASNSKTDSGEAKAVSNSADAAVDQNYTESSESLASTAAAPASKGAAVESGGDQNAVITHSTAENAADGTAGFTGNDVVAGLNMKLIYHANLNMEVENYAKAQTEVRNMVSLANGYIIEFTETSAEYEQGGTFILKVPASGFSSFLSNLDKVEHEKLERSIKGQDVSEEYVDLGSRLKAKQLMEIQYTEFMKKATKSSDLVSFANELGAIQEQIEQIKGRMRYIDQNVSFSTVELRLYQTDKAVVVKEETDQGPLMDRASSALNGSLHAISVTFQWIVVILAGALPLLIVVGIVLAIAYWFRKNTLRQRNEETERIRRTSRQDVKESTEEEANKEE
ncbi:DUF4349 domain-containing protein [Paenibacillus sp. 19GGS1-52]|uniref:DUF4349 domain-containing protein n=1 Tax=Paenibacillus sp. 19GGS1-52 TaxID=2758563 RepID=UPI001EFBDE6C|nr:DUF4349 domain-containing protein [Paenibacillus sp. 19GGS1-52]ULO09084.1 DUF4349 domain-containing protein [Paenibacillus sp. 19GGS1-52]